MPDTAQPAAHSAARRLRVASYNIHKCVGLDGRRDPARIAAVIGELDADILALQEADRRFGDRAGLLDLDRIAAETGLVPVPVTRARRSHGWRGNLVLTRVGDVAGVRQLSLPGLEPRGALMVDLDIDGAAIGVVAAHLGLLRHSRALQVRAILGAIGAETAQPTLLLGDMNEWRLGRRSALQGFGPDYAHQAAPVRSFPANFPLLALDRIIARPAGLLSAVAVHDSPTARVASDHLPVVASLTLAPTPP